jgi:hypothetical protein
MIHGKSIENARALVNQEGTARQIRKMVDPSSEYPQITVRTIRKARQGRLPALERIAIAKFTED